MGGTVGVVCNDTGRYSMFSVCLTLLQRPEGTVIDWGLSTDVPKARNTLVQRFMDGDGEWMMFLDDDHVFPGDLLMRLLQHDVDMVCSLYLRRAKPFAPVAFTERSGDQTYKALELHETPGTGLVPIWATGCAGMLVKRHVFEKVGSPWFQYGQVGNWDASEDIVFCEKVRQAGFQCWLDLDARLGHMTPAAIWPTWVDQEWAVGFSVADGTQLLVPIEKPADAQSAQADAKQEVAA